MLQALVLLTIKQKTMHGLVVDQLQVEHDVDFIGYNSSANRLVGATVTQNGTWGSSDNFTIVTSFEVLVAYSLTFQIKTQVLMGFITELFILWITKMVICTVMMLQLILQLEQIVVKLVLIQKIQ